MVIYRYLSNLPFCLYVGISKNSRFSGRATAIILLTLLLTETSFAAVSASLNRSKIELNETAQLIIRSDNVNSGSNPDLSALEQNFTILGTSTSQNISIINGVQKSEKNWVSEIEPKSPGSFIIPPIKVGSEQTQTLRLTVLPESSPDPDNPKDIFVEFKTDNPEPYVQQQVIATVKLYLGVNIIDGSLTDPTAKDVNVIRLGQDVQYTEQINGKPYRVIERTYALFPATSGKVSIDPIRFQGLLQNPSSSNRTYSLFNQGNRVTEKSESLTLQVKPPAPEFTGRVWLPAKNLQLENLSTDLTDAEPGQPINLQIRLKATGLSSEQLPDIELPQSDSFKQYSDKPIRKNDHQNRDILSTLTQSIAIIAGKSGLLQIPEIRLHWWNTETDQMQTLSLPAREILIKALTTKREETTSAQPVIVESQQPEKNTQTIIQNNPSSNPDNQNQKWIWLSMLLFTGWTITGWFLTREIRRHRTAAQSQATESKSSTSLAQIQNQIQLACKNNHQQKCRQLILAWAKQRWPTSCHRGLDDIANIVATENLKIAIKELDSTLYFTQSSDEKPTWNGDKLSRAFSEYIASSSQIKAAKTTSLPVLYPA